MGVGVDREGPGGSSRSLLCPLSVPSVNLVKWSSQGMLRMSPEAMSELFQPTITHIIQHIGGAWPVPVHGHPLSLSHPLSLCHPLSLDHSPALLLGAPHSWDHFHPWNTTPIPGSPFIPGILPVLGTITVPMVPHCWDHPMPERSPPSLGQSHTLGSALSLGPSLSLEPLLCPWDHPCSWNLLHPWDPPFLEPSLSLGTFYPWNSIVSRTLPVPRSPFYPWNQPHSWTPLILAPHHPHPLSTTPIPNLLFSPPLQTLS